MPGPALAAVLIAALLGGPVGTANADAPTPDPGSGPVSAPAPGAASDIIVDDPPVLVSALIRDGKPVDGIPSGPMVDGGYHIHAHLRMFIDGTEAWVPAGVGVTRPIVLDPDRKDPVVKAAMAYYWLHTHDESGVIHAEAPEEHHFTLGQFFDIWGQPLTRHQVGPAKGDVKVLVDGKPFTGDPRDVPITPHGVIQLNVGRDVEFQPYDFPPPF